MKKFLLSFFTIMSFFFYIILSEKSTTLSYLATQPVTGATKNPSPTPTETSVTPPSAKEPVKTPPKTPVPVVPPYTPPPTPPKPKGLYRDGSYIGNSVDAYYGYIEVKAVIQDGKLADIIFLDYPHDRGTSIRINSYAMPILKSEAIQAQNTNVDTVSGASDSSAAFRDSLASALAQAKN
jgi:uncharacterized protein with FMN-binding domain